MQDLDILMQQVAEEARGLGIPVSRAISPTVRVNGRATSRLGCCRCLPDGSFEIELSKRALEGDENTLRQLLAHELLHTCPGCQNHGAMWKKYAAIMEKAMGYTIKRTVEPQELGLGPKESRYTLVCRQCGAEIHRQRQCRLTRYPWLYRCRCGGKLTKG